MTRITGQIVVDALADVVAPGGRTTGTSDVGRAHAVPGVLPARGGSRRREQPGPGPAAAADANGIKPPGQGAVHAVREAIYLSPGHGSEEPVAQ
ncbi:MAG: hypothetical protein ABSA02_13685 [Trebonia sp.]|jgi:hypothetical protein